MKMDVRTLAQRIATLTDRETKVIHLKGRDLCYSYQISLTVDKIRYDLLLCCDEREDYADVVLRIYSRQFRYINVTIDSDRPGVSLMLDDNALEDAAESCANLLLRTVSRPWPVILSTYRPTSRQARTRRQVVLDRKCDIRFAAHALSRKGTKQEFLDAFGEMITDSATICSEDHIRIAKNTAKIFGISEQELRRIRTRILNNIKIASNLK